MSDLIVIVYPTEAQAEAVRARVLDLQNEYLIELGDAVIATKDSDGRVKLNQLMNTTAAGAMSGSLWGLLIGTIFLMPIVGVALGAASGALGGALTDLGIDDDFMTQLGATIQPGNAALFLLVRKMTADKVANALSGTGGTILRTSLDHSTEEALGRALAAIKSPTTDPTPEVGGAS